MLSVVDVVLMSAVTRYQEASSRISPSAQVILDLPVANQKAEE